MLLLLLAAIVPTTDGSDTEQNFILAIIYILLLKLISFNENGICCFMGEGEEGGGWANKVNQGRYLFIILQRIHTH